MTPAKRSSRPAPQPEGGPAASHINLPPQYGVPKGKQPLLPWSHVEKRMADAKVYWVCVVSPEGRPHATPVDGLWHDNVLYFGGSPATRRMRYLAANPAASVHLEDGYNVVTMNGEAREEQGITRELAERLAALSNEKYGYGQTPDSYLQGSVWAFRPREVFAWGPGLKGATRWRFDGG